MPGAKRDFVTTALITVILIVLVVGTRSVLSTLLKAEVPMAVVSSWSMEPVLHVGDILVVAGEKSPKIGDVILFKSPQHGRLVVHRVVNVAPEGYITKGDANPVPDFKPVPRRNVVGRVIIVIPYLGALRLVIGKILGI